jgi:hypothetical protein
MTGRKRRLLIAYSYNSTFVTTTRDYLDSFRLFSGWEVHYVHVIEGARVEFDFSSYDALFHNYCARLCFDDYVSPSYLEAARRFDGVKILAVQDEYDFTDKVRKAAADIGFDIFLTCVPEESLEYVYPRHMFPKTEFMQVLTGYVPISLTKNAIAAPPLHERPRRISYRGRDIGARYGRLGFDKLDIGRRMQELCAARGFETDIASGEESRFYGDEWFRFLGACRATLGTESGSNVFDFDGAVIADFDRMARRLERPPIYPEFEPRIRHLEAKIDMGQISPRVFEAAVMRTPMILFEGRYSGVLTPGTHYIPLKKDFSNIDDVLRQLDDLPLLCAIAERAYADLVTSQRYSYQAFVSRVIGAVEQRLGTRPPQPGAGQAVGTTADMLAARLASGEALLEMPTSEPLSRDWYHVSNALRYHETITSSLTRLMRWARSEAHRYNTPDLEANKGLEAGFAAFEEQARACDRAFVTALQAAYAERDAECIADATRNARIGYEALMATLVETVLNGRSRLARNLAVLRAPWVEADVLALRRTKHLRERVYGIRGVREALAFIRRR